MSTSQRPSRRQLNRTLLRRQFLDVPSALPVTDAVERVAGMQAQVPKDPYIGLLARLESVRPGDLGDEITARRLVRVALMRSTIHLVTAADCWAFRPAVQPALDRELRTVATWARPLAGVDVPAVVAEARTLLRGQPMTNAELGARLQERWPDRDGRAMAYAVRNREPLIQVPPRGLWGVPGQPRHATARDWLGGAPAQWPPADPRPGLEAMVARYLTAFGPATVRDIQAWAGPGWRRLSRACGPGWPGTRGRTAGTCGTCPTACSPTRARPLGCGCCRSTTTRSSATPTAAVSCRTASRSPATRPGCGPARWSGAASCWTGS